ATRYPLNQRTAGSFDCGARTGRGAQALERDLAAQLAGLDDLGVAHVLADDAGLLEDLDVDFVDGQGLKVGQANFGAQHLAAGSETALGQAAIQRHLAAFEADFMEAAGTRLLALVAATRGLAQAGTDSAADATLGVLAAGSRLQCVQLSIRHPDSFQASETVTR